MHCSGDTIFASLHDKRTGTLHHVHDSILFINRSIYNFSYYAHAQLSDFQFNKREGNLNAHIVIACIHMMVISLLE